MADLACNRITCMRVVHKPSELDSVSTVYWRVVTIIMLSVTGRYEDGIPVGDSR